MVKVGVIGAMNEEVALLRQKIIDPKVREDAICRVDNGKLYGVEIALLQSGIGKVSAAVSTTLLIDRYKPDYIINTGSAGSLVSSVKVGDIVVSDYVCYHDVDMCAFDYQPGQIAGCPQFFSADLNLIKLVGECLRQLNCHAKQGLVCSGDRFVNGGESLEYIRTTFPAAIAVDMEAAAIAHVCYLYQVPFVMVRGISDMSDDISHIFSKKFLDIAASNVTTVVECMLQHIGK